MKIIGRGILISWICLSCNQNESQEQKTGRQDPSATGNIRGIVSFKQDEKTLPDAGTTVYVISTTSSNNSATAADKFKNRYFQSVVDADGNYTFNNLPADTYTVVFKSKNAPKKLSYYQTRYSPALEPLVNDKPINNLDPKQAKKARINEFFKEKQLQVKSEVKLEAGSTQIVTQEFIIH